VPPPALLQTQKTSLAKDSKVLRGVVLGDPGAFSDLGDVERRINQQADDADARLFGERLQGDDAIVIGGSRGGGSLTVWEAIERKRLGCGPGPVHLCRDQNRTNRSTRQAVLRSPESHGSLTSP
jgi:hypothetical protein